MPDDLKLKYGKLKSRPDVYQLSYEPDGSYSMEEFTGRFQKEPLPDGLTEIDRFIGKAGQAMEMADVEIKNIRLEGRYTMEDLSNLLTSGRQVEAFQITEGAQFQGDKQTIFKLDNEGKIRFHAKDWTLNRQAPFGLPAALHKMRKG